MTGVIRLEGWRPPSGTRRGAVGGPVPASEREKAAEDDYRDHAQIDEVGPSPPAVHPVEVESHDRGDSENVDEIPHYAGHPTPNGGAAQVTGDASGRD